MDDVWARAGLILGALAVAVLISYVLRRRSERPFRTVTTTGFDPGVYLFSSATCSTCAAARAQLDERLGSGKYREMVWEEDAESFGALGIDAVPSVLVVGPGDRGRLYVGVGAALGGVDP